MMPAWGVIASNRSNPLSGDPAFKSRPAHHFFCIPSIGVASTKVSEVSLFPLRECSCIWLYVGPQQGLFHGLEFLFSDHVFGQLGQWGVDGDVIRRPEQRLKLRDELTVTFFCVLGTNEWIVGEHPHAESKCAAFGHAAADASQPDRSLGREARQSGGCDTAH